MSIRHDIPSGALLRGVILWAWLVLVLVAPTASGAPPLRVEAEAAPYLLGRSLQYLEDTEGRLDFEDIRDRGDALPWRSFDRDDVLLRSKDGPTIYWLRQALSGTAAVEEPWLIQITQPSLHLVEFWALRADGRETYQRAGAHLSFRERVIPHRHFVFPVALQAAAPTQIYMRLESPDAVLAVARAWPYERFFAVDQLELLAHGVYFGIIAVMMLYNFFVYMTTKDRSYLVYVAFVLSSGLMVAGYTGIGFQFLWSDSPWIQQYARALFGACMIVSACFFTDRFLRLPRRSPRLSILLRSSLVIPPLVVAGYAIHPIGRTAALHGAAVAAALLPLAGIIEWRRGSEQARYFTAAWLILSLGLLTPILRFLDWLPMNWFTLHGLEIGSALEVILLSLALAARIRGMRQREESAKAESMTKSRFISNLQLVQKVTFAASASASTEGALAASLEVICREGGWDIGHVVVAGSDEAHALIPTETRFMIDPERWQSFFASELMSAPLPKTGLVARAATSGSPLAISDLRARPDPEPRTKLALDHGIMATASVPIRVGDQIASILEFGACEATACEDETAELFQHLGSLLGQIIEQKRNEERMRALSHHDALTGLPDSQLFHQRIEAALDQAKQHRRTVALLFVNLDDFDFVNEALGHAAGDELLCRVAERLSQRIRYSDFVARPLGDEDDLAPSLGNNKFTVLLPSISTQQDAALVAARLIQALSEPIRLPDQSVSAEASVGIAIYPDDGEDLQTLTNNAESAICLARAHGTGHYAFFSEALDRESHRRIELEERLRGALENDEFRVFYQPQQSTETGEIVSAEALVRWLDPERGLVLPNDFVPVAERAGLIGAIGEWVLGEVCRQSMAWQAAGFEPIRIAVNTSAYQLRAGNFAKTVADALEESGLSPEHLEIEITETAMHSEGDQTKDVLTEISRLGVSLSLDDFGTGSSSIMHLRIFPIDCVKIDRHFLTAITTDQEDQSIVAAIVGMARGLGHRVVAEGVQTEEQAAILTASGCTFLQGWLIGKPVDAETFVHYLRPAKDRAE